MKTIAITVDFDETLITKNEAAKLLVGCVNEIAVLIRKQTNALDLHGGVDVDDKYDDWFDEEEDES